MDDLKRLTHLGRMFLSLSIILAEQRVGMEKSACNVLMIFPLFHASSFWNYQETCKMLGARYPAAPLGLITVAAMLPETWPVKLINRNTEELTDADFEWADMVMTGGMLPQQVDTLAIIDLAHAQGKLVVVGGPGVTATPEAYEAADFRVLGEAESILQTFMDAWLSGAKSGTFEAPRFKADVTKSPVPRFDLLQFDQYLHVGVQLSRGCPFTCEFCDIIELYGRVPRAKTPDQIFTELDRLYELGYRGHVDFVDDNLIGNKKALMIFLPRLKAWQEEHDYPFEFSTEASINLADDATLMAMLRDTNFFAIFVGIESPDTETLVAMQKKQNTKRSLEESIARIYAHGMFVIAGFIVGFDNERGSIAQPMIGLIEEAAIPVAMVGLLYALPETQLTRRLAEEGRLYTYEIEGDGKIYGDQCAAGLNFKTRRPRREILVDYRTVLDSIYAPDKFFGRVRRMAEQLRVRPRTASVIVRTLLRDSRWILRLVFGFMTARPDVRREVWKTISFLIRKNPDGLTAAMQQAALYIHLGPFSRYVIQQIDQQIEAIDRGTWRAPPLVERLEVQEPDKARQAVRAPV